MKLNYYHLLETDKMQKEIYVRLVEEIIHEENLELKQGVISGDIHDFLEKTKEYKERDLYFLDNIIGSDNPFADIGTDAGKIIKERVPDACFVLISFYHASCIPPEYIYVPKTLGMAEDTSSMKENIKIAIKTYILMNHEQIMQKKRDYRKKKRIEEKNDREHNMLFVRKIGDNIIEYVSECACYMMGDTIKNCNLKHDHLHYCSKSVLVNINKIVGYNKTKNRVVLSNDDEIPVSIQFQRNMKKVLKERNLYQ